MGTGIHGNTSYEPLTTFVRRTMRSRQDVSINFGSFLPKFGCHGNSLGSLEILDSIFEIADPRTLLYTQNLCRYLVQKWSYAYLNVWRIFTIAGIGNFLVFLWKIVEIVKKILIKPIKGTRIHGNTSYEPLTTFLRRTMRSVQVSKNVRK